MKFLILMLSVTFMGISLAHAAPQLLCSPAGESEVQFSSQATVLSEDKVSDLTIKYADESHFKAGVIQGKRAQVGELAGMMTFFMSVDGGSLGIAVPKGFSRMIKPFRGYFILAGAGSGGASEVKCSMSSAL